ncbi:MAG TPA: efflux RND transporter periplasmic adaptor subunit [Ignavibacteria bacterium]|nr:efflux RND transporter periplasmic adaptor subunit [Ignavibacteria bacterium]
MSDQTNPQVIQTTPSQVVKPVVKKKKKSRKKLFIIGGIVLLLLIIITVIVSGKKEKTIEVQTEKISKMNITQVVQATGKIQSEIQVNISSEVSGEIISLPFKEGDEIKKGALLVKIKPDAYIPQLQQQVANVKVQESALNEQEVQLRRFELELSRTKELVTKGLASQSELDNAQSNYDQALATVGRVRAQITQSRASLSSVQYDLSKTSIFAPVSGTVTALNNEVGEKVLGTSFNQGSNIMSISDLSKMECQVEVGETDVTLIKLGDTARIEIDAFPDKIFKGYVYEVGNSAKSKATGTQEEVVNFIVKIRIIDNDVDLRPGMSCNVDIEVARKENVLAVPIQSVTTREDFNAIQNTDMGNENLMRSKDVDAKKKLKPQEVVFIVEGTVSKLKNVKTGISNDTYIEVTEGLAEGEEVVKGSFKAISKELENDTKVKVNNDVKKKSFDEE